MLGFSNFEVKAVFSRYDDNFNFREIGSLKNLLENTTVVFDATQVSDWSKKLFISPQPSRMIRYNLGSFTCRNSLAIHLTRSRQLKNIFSVIKLCGFIITISPNNDDFKNSLEFFKQIDLVQGYVKNGSIFDIFCKGGNSVGLVIGLLRDFNELNFENALKILQPYPDYSLFVQAKMGKIPKDYQPVMMSALNFLGNTNENGKSIHDSWLEFLENDISLFTIKQYLKFIIDYLKIDAVLPLKFGIRDSLSAQTHLNTIENLLGEKHAKSGL